MTKKAIQNFNYGISTANHKLVSVKPINTKSFLKATTDFSKIIDKNAKTALETLGH